MSYPNALNLANNYVGSDGALPVTLSWGTDGIYTGVIVKSIKSSQMVEEIKIENGSGVTCKHILIVDGTMVDFTVVDDRNITWPAVGTNVTLLDPLPTGAGATSTIYTVVSNGWSGGRKQDGERTVTGRKFSLITPAAY